MSRPKANAVSAMKLLALVGAIAACGMSGAQQPVSRQAAPRGVKQVAMTSGDATQRSKVRVTRRSPRYWRVTLDNPPLNLNTLVTLDKLMSACREIAADERVRVVVVTGSGSKAF